MSPILYIGNGSILLATGLALFGMIVFFVALRTASSTAASFGRAAVYGNFILFAVANLAMVYALLSNDFGVSYVAHVGSQATPRWIAAISLWSSLEGSILFWGFILSAYSAVCIYVYRERADPSTLRPLGSARGRLRSGQAPPAVSAVEPLRTGLEMAGVGLVLLFIQLFFCLLLAGPSNPFLPVVPAPPDGPGPNPLLQNHWLMAAHPPCLYVGYIGFTIPFAFAIAALIGGGGEGWPWISLARRWTLFAWSFQSIAIVLGGWWSYAVLGWGGYWAWDPVENASLMPWLSGTALLHSMIVQEKRGMLPVWNLFLAILTFLLTLLGTFLTRSGVLESVHSFTESPIGPYFLVFIGVVLALSVGLLIWRGGRFHTSHRIENLASLESLFLFNNLFFLGFCLVVFLGTLYPLVVEALKGSRISVGEPYFNQMTAPIVGAILLLMGIAWATPWRQMVPKILWKSVRLPTLISVLVVATAFWFGARKAWVIATLFLSALAAVIMLLDLGRLLRAPALRQASLFLRLCSGRTAGLSKGSGQALRVIAANPRRWSGLVAHMGALLVVVAVALSSSYEEEREVTLKKGESVTVGSYLLTFEGVSAFETPQRFEVRSRIEINRDGKFMGALVPRMNYYPQSREPIGSPAIRSTLARDLYLSLIQVEKDGSAVSLRAIVAPAVVWIWIGGFIVMVGGCFAALGGRKSEVTS